ncbi:ADP-ribosylation factor protein 3 [Spiromyces aspiralis]|uniref:ADP-ribosylation factor protein 3 n=1 Tax=Spiromyces aspiralis TaxID=68401 RepID=A0ACC1HIN8_9FUNG|nr:ADP-ribosylation factor protein 3 [Spiromyces aspiralis]
MFSLIRETYRYLTRQEQYSVIMLGLDGAGKTASTTMQREYPSQSILIDASRTLLEKIKTMYTGKPGLSPDKIYPTVGLNMTKIHIEKCNLRFLDLGGQVDLHSIWQSYYSDSHAILFVIDSVDKDRIPMCKRTFEALMTSPELEGVPVMILANKQDNSDALGLVQVKEIINRMVDTIDMRDARVMGTSGLTGEGVREAIEWLYKRIQENRASRPPEFLKGVLEMSLLDTVTSRMSQLMLKRWAMLAEQCEVEGCGAPLMRDPETKSKLCVIHDWKAISGEQLESGDNDGSEDADAGNKENIGSAPNHDRAPESRHPDGHEVPKSAKLDSINFSERRAQTERAADLISKKMLQGWTLIDRVCPNESCNMTPLVRDRDMVELCVVCGQQYMTEDNWRKRHPNVPPVAEQSQAEATKYQVRRPKTSEDVEAPAEGRVGPTTYEPAEPPAVPQIEEHTATATPSSGSTLDQTSNLSRTLDVLNAKLKSLVDLLEATSDPAAIGNICEAIEKCSWSINSLTRITGVINK